MYFSKWLAHHTYGLRSFSCACQCGPARGWMARQMLLPFSYCQNWHVRLLPVDYFWRFLLLRRLPLQLPCTQTSRMSSCRTLLQNPIPVCRLVLPTSWGSHEGESSSVLQGPFSWRRLIQGKVEGNYSVPLVLQQIYWMGDLIVLSLRISLRVSACWVCWWGESNRVNPPILILKSH